jgi:AmpE protein
MTIISILIAFTLCHLVRNLRRLRRFEWVTPFTRQCNNWLDFLPGWSGPTGFFILLGLPLLVIYIVNYILFGIFGQLGSFVFSIAILIYTFGPRDLDVDVRSVILADDDASQKEALETLLGSPIPADPDDCQTAAIDAVFNKAMKRWFGIIFWFALLGIYGALLYRLSVWLSGEDFGLHDDQKGLITRLREVMEWPVAQLMTLSLAIATDFDSVFSAWKKYHVESGHGLFEGNNLFLLTSARTIVKTGHAAQDGYADQLQGPMASIKLAMDLVWRSLGVWATVLALLLLVNVIA